MQAKWTASVCAVVLTFALGALAQGNDNGSQNDQSPVLKTRPRDDSNNPATQAPPANRSGQGTYIGQPAYASPSSIPEGTRFIVKLKDTLDTRKMQEGKHFKAELREDL